RQSADHHRCRFVCRHSVFVVLSPFPAPRGQPGSRARTRVDQTRGRTAQQPCGRGTGVKFKRGIKSEVGIDLTSLIDVVFLLLIFFMVTSTFTRQSNLLINLPEADGSPTEEAALRIEILVSRDGGYSVNGR